MKLTTVISRSCRLRCPACGRGKFANSWLATEDQCAYCDLDFRVDWGFYLGSIYVSYAVTGVILTAVCVPLVVGQYVPFRVLTPLALAFCVFFPIWFWRYARSLWFGINCCLDESLVSQRDVPTDVQAQAARREKGPQTDCESSSPNTAER